MRLTINFLLKKARKKANGEIPIYIRFTMSGKRVELSTGIYVNPENWDDVGQQVKGRTEKIKIINNHLDSFHSEILDYYNQLKSTGQEFNVATIKKKLLKTDDSKGVLYVFDYYLDSIYSKLTKGYAQNTYRNYKTSRKRVGEFIKSEFKKGDFPLEGIDYKFLDSFDVFLKQKFKVNQNTAWNFHKHFRCVLNVAVSMDYISKNPYEKYKVKLEETHREFLTIEELTRIEEKAIKIERLDAVRDIFVFACYTGLSYSDISKLNNSHIRIGADQNEWIVIDRTKTKSRCRIPILPKAKSILAKYKTFPENLSKELLLPVLSNQKMNSYLKELGDICNINKTITMHTARHTFATSITLGNGVPIETVSKILGHSSLKTTQIYARILDKKISEDMGNLHLKLQAKKVVNS
jgi:site-specific recombinase XerD